MGEGTSRTNTPTARQLRSEKLIGISDQWFHAFERSELQAANIEGLIRTIKDLVEANSAVTDANALRTRVFEQHLEKSLSLQTQALSKQDKIIQQNQSIIEGIEKTNALLTELLHNSAAGSASSSVPTQTSPTQSPTSPQQDDQPPYTSKLRKRK